LATAASFLPVLASVGITGTICVALFFSSKRIISRSRLPGSIQLIVIRLLSGPVVAGIAAGGLLIGASYVEASQPSLLPSFLKIPELELILEIVVLAVFIRTVGVIVKLEIPNLIKAKEADKILVYSVYGAGLIALVYILLGSSLTHSPLVTASIWAVLSFVTGLFITYLAVYIVNVVFKRYAGVIENKEASWRTTLTFLRRLVLSIVALIGVAVATFASFPSVGVAIASLFIAAGFASIVIGLVSQTSLSNLIAGMVISTSQPFRVGDALSYANEWAWVEDIKLTFTILRTWDNRRLIVPNQLFLSTTMVNYDYADSSKLCIVYVTIAYDSDLDKAIEILKDAAKKHPDFLPAGNLPVVHVMDLGDANGSTKDANATPGIYLRLLSRAKDHPTNFQMSKDLLYEVKKRFDENGIEIAYPSRRIIMDSKPSRSGKVAPQDWESFDENNDAIITRSFATKERDSGSHD
jgi:small conductance mechanosensitive channel